MSHYGGISGGDLRGAGGSKNMNNGTSVGVGNGSEILLTPEQVEMIEKKRLEAQKRKEKYLESCRLSLGRRSTSGNIKITDYFGTSFKEERSKSDLINYSSNATKNKTSLIGLEGISSTIDEIDVKDGNFSICTQSSCQSGATTEDDMNSASLSALELENCTNLNFCSTTDKNTTHDADKWIGKYLQNSVADGDGINDNILQSPRKSKNLADSNLASMLGTPRKSSLTLDKLSTIQEDKKFEKPNFLLHVKDKSGVRIGEDGYDSRQIYIPPEAWRKFTVSRRQYWEYKQDHNDEIVFFQQGDFFCLFALDAEVGIKEFGLVYCKQLDCVGVNRRQIYDWCAKFVLKGYKVAIFEQVNTAITDEQKEAKKKNKSVELRLVTEIFTPGTINNFQYIKDEYMPFYLMVIIEGQSQAARCYGGCFIDVSTYEWKIWNFCDDSSYTQLQTLLFNIRPKEILHEKLGLSAGTKRIFDNCCSNSCCFSLVDEFPSRNESEQLFQFYFNDSKQENFFINEKNSNYSSNIKLIDNYFKNAQEHCEELTCRALGASIRYLKTIKRSFGDVGLNRKFITLDKDIVQRANYGIYNVYTGVGLRTLVLDADTLTNLEILENSENQTTSGTLLSSCNMAVTPFGKRLMRSWVCHPLYEPVEIEKRQKCVEYFLNNLNVTKSMRESLMFVKDLERLITRVQVGSATLGMISNILDSLETLVTTVNDAKVIMPTGGFPEHLKELLLSIPDISDLFKNCSFDRQKARLDEKYEPLEGTDHDYDVLKQELHDLEESIDRIMHDLQSSHKECKLSFCNGKMNRYLVCVPPEYKSKFPTWKAVKEVKKGMQCSVPEIEQIVSSIGECESRLKLAQFEFVSKFVLEFLDEYYMRCMWLVRVVAQIDALMGLAEYSRVLMSMHEICLPTLCREPKLSMKSGIHPYVVPIGGGSFVANDMEIGGEHCPSTLLVTGPNAGGKSTLLRQICVLVVMAQLGSYVPALKFEFRPIDRIFTRTGARDSIMSGKSTFFVELEATAKILNECTEQSLVVIDELGRGTSTFDGYAIAYATLEHLRKFGTKVLFSTHYHNLTREYDSSSVKVAHMSCCRRDENSKVMTFLYKLVDGPSANSYGLEVASMSDIPVTVIERASQMSKYFEFVNQYKKRKRSRESAINALTLLKELLKNSFYHRDALGLHEFARRILKNNNT